MPLDANNKLALIGIHLLLFVAYYHAVGRSRENTGLMEQRKRRFTYKNTWLNFVYSFF